MNRDYLQDALHTFNTDTPNWYGWKKFDAQGNKIPNEHRMCYECIEIIKDGAVMPTKAEVEAKIQEIKDAAAQKIANKELANAKLRALGLTDDEIEAFRS
jgi:hypothetical protein